jgi:hypothetical protein
MEERPYPSEDLLQELLAKYPNLQAGNQINIDKPRKWLLVSREAALPSEGKISTKLLRINCIFINLITLLSYHPSGY